MRKRSLDDIFADDEIIGLPAEPTAGGTVDSRIRQDFEDISRFVDDNGRPPEAPDAASGRKVSAIERSLAIRLKQYRARPDLAAALHPLDRYRLLAPVAKQERETRPAPSSVDEILDADDGILSSEHDDIFELRFVGARRADTDWVAGREPCKDFHLFSGLFEACAADIASGRRSTYRFTREQEISAGDFYVLNGIIVYVAEVNDPHVRSGRKNARLRCIYDNGTESELLLRSLSRLLYRDENGRRVSNPEAGPLFVTSLADGDVKKGCVYIAASLSSNPAVAGMKNLYKVGVTTGKPERRVRRAEHDPTFLMAPARLLKSYTIYNADPGKVESILHAFFAEVCLGVDIKDRFGKPIKPREWFVVPMAALDEAIQKLFDGTINQYRYDRNEQSLVKACP